MLRIKVTGHALKEIYCYDTVSHKTAAVCECGWKGSFRSGHRAREAHREHKQNVIEAKQAKEKGWPPNNTINKKTL